MSYSGGTIWWIIVVLGVGTYLIRLSFLGLIGNRRMPGWVLRHLRYTPVSVLPALVAPLAVFPGATDGAVDPPRLAAAAVTLVVAYIMKNMLWGVLGGAGTLAALLWLS